MKNFADNQTAFHRRNFLKLTAATLLGPNAAHAQNKIGPPISIDMHAHWEPENYRQALLKLGYKPQGPANPLSFDLNKRRQWMDGHGVQMHVLTLSGQMPWQWVTPEAGATLAQMINDANVEAHKTFPDRFVGAIEMSIRDPKLALRELNRMAGKPGMHAVHLPNAIEGKDYLFEPRYLPLLARCEELGYPLLFHPLDGEANYYSPSRLGDKRSVETNLNNTLGFPFDSATTAAKFVTTGTLDKFPKLEIVLPHSGGTFPYVAGRIEHGLNRKKIATPHPFKDYIRRFYYDTLAYYHETLRFLINTVGSDRVVIGTDNYAVMDVEYPNALVEQLNLPALDRERILRGNAKRLLRL